MVPFDQVAHEALNNRRAAIHRAGGSLTAEEQREVGDIDAALGRIAQGCYGHCESCGGAVGRQRLRAIPEARRCSGCG
jgi:DnaK suppressor protein